MTQSDSKGTLIVHISLWKLLQAIILSLGFVVMGLFIIVMPVNSSKARIPGYREFIISIGIMGVVFGGSLVLAYLIYIIKRRSIKWPILTLNVHGITDHHHNLFIPFTDIKRMWLTEDTRKLLPLQRIQLDMVDPQRYAVVEQRLKRRGWYNTDVILVLTLASAKDFRLARDYIRRHIKGVENDGIHTLD